MITRVNRTLNFVSTSTLVFCMLHVLYVPSWLWWCDIAMHSYVLQIPPYFNSYGPQESGRLGVESLRWRWSFFRVAFFFLCRLYVNEWKRKKRKLVSLWATREGVGDSPNSFTRCCVRTGVVGRTDSGPGCSAWLNETVRTELYWQGKRRRLQLLVLVLAFKEPADGN